MSPYQDKLYTKQFTLQKLSLKKNILQTTVLIFANKKHCLEF